MGALAENKRSGGVSIDLLSSRGGLGGIKFFLY